MNEVLAYIEQEVLQCLVNALAGMLGTAPASQKVPSFSTAADTIWFQQTFNPANFGSLAYGIDRAGALAAGKKLLAAADLAEESDSVALETLSEIFAQVSGSVSSSFTSRVKKEVSPKTFSEKQNGMDTFQSVYQLSLGDDVQLLFVCCPDAKMLDALMLETAVTPSSIPAQPEASPINRNLEVLLDVELPVSVSFGRAQLPLKDVVKLTTGSIVELNRSVSEPVDIVVNNCVIARGEVVVIEGNFGVRIKQVISKQDRLRTLG